MTTTKDVEERPIPQEKIAVTQHTGTSGGQVIAYKDDLARFTASAIPEQL